MIDPGNSFLDDWVVIPFVAEYANELAREEGGVRYTFMPSEEELYQLAKYWAREGLEIIWFYYVYAEPTEQDIRRVYLAESRLTCIAGELGSAKVDKAVKEVESWREMIDQRWWEFVRLGDTVTGEELRQKYHDLVSTVYGDSYNTSPGDDRHKE